MEAPQSTFAYVSLFFSVSAMCCFIFYTSPSILTLLCVILLQRFSISTISLCTIHLYFSITHTSFFGLFSEGPKGTCSFSILCLLSVSLSKDFNGCFFFNFISVPKGTQRFPSKPKTPPSSEVPQTKPSKRLVYLIILISVSYEDCYQWSFRFICIPWACMLEHYSKDKTQYYVSWHVEITSNLASLKSLSSVLFYIFSHCNGGHFLCSWQVK